MFGLLQLAISRWPRAGEMRSSLPEYVPFLVNTLHTWGETQNTGIFTLHCCCCSGRIWSLCAVVCFIMIAFKCVNLPSHLHIFDILLNISLPQLSQRPSPPNCLGASNAAAAMFSPHYAAPLRLLRALRLHHIYDLDRVKLPSCGRS